MREYLDKQKLLMALNDKYHDMSAMPASYYAGFQYAIKLIEKAARQRRSCTGKTWKFDRRFQIEDEGFLVSGETFRWTMLDEPLNMRLF